MESDEPSSGYDEEPVSFLRDAQVVEDQQEGLPRILHSHDKPAELPDVEESDGSFYDPSSEPEGADAEEDGGAGVNPFHAVEFGPTERLSAPWSSPLKRPSGSPPPNDRPFKRVKGTVNHEYLNLLNTDIRGAAARFVPHDGADLLRPSQMGLTFWTHAEKELFFEALTRLGMDDVAGIASRIKTKDELEVAQYLKLLQNSTKSEEGREPVQPVDLPAAVELSQACCNALEEAADAVSVRQETYEESIEKKRWGQNHWLITASNCEVTESSGTTVPPQLRKPLELFRTGNWLTLSRRVFMNASFQEYNWESISPEEPAIRATALQDFYTLAVSLTKKLVAATIYVSESRIRAKRAVYADTKSWVWKPDVEAAVLSLGLKPNSDIFWAKAARRLRLDVYDDGSGNPSDRDLVGEEEEPEPMDYDDVERALGDQDQLPAEETSLPPDQEEEGEGEEEDDDEESSEDEELAPTSGQGPTRQDVEEDDDGGGEDEEVDEEVQQDMDEVLRFSALEYPPTPETRRALKDQIKAEREQEAYADLKDAQTAYKEEKRLWQLLDKAPPEGVLNKPPELPQPPPSPQPKLTDVGGLYMSGRTDWREKLLDINNNYPGGREWELQQLSDTSSKRKHGKRVETTEDDTANDTDI
ncbi:hypothetical protein QBC46DRAFT_384662 [Diplogelasinospora grovesii]|uniref:SANT domain-containing protein n=1 Tax=Diplogelasinospora grovesii TaxID=303347 RepID=A0AAN6S4X5_9PEZI|nr:hypothetical protein QBC46DRAFT_384662 [Diplogelasinospora grovesii]